MCCSVLQCAAVCCRSWGFFLTSFSFRSLEPQCEEENWTRLQVSVHCNSNTNSATLCICNTMQHTYLTDRHAHIYTHTHTYKYTSQKGRIISDTPRGSSALCCSCYVLQCCTLPRRRGNCNTLQLQHNATHLLCRHTHSHTHTHTHTHAYTS